MLYDVLVEKHLLLYFDDPDLQATVISLGVGGAIQPTQGDYLYVVNTSMEEKVYHSIDEQIEYDAQLDAIGGVSAQTVITWSYPADASISDPAIARVMHGLGQQAPILLNLTRIYVPRASEWLSTNDKRLSTYFGVEADRLMIGTRADVSAGQRKQVSYRYRVPAAVKTLGEQHVYHLVIQKQPGTHGSQLSVRVTLPPGAELVSADPKLGSAAPGESTMLEFHSRLTTDQVFEVVYR